jgi:hypothetical protein
MRQPKMARVERGHLVPMTLQEWAARFNADHRLAPPKGKR